MAFFGARKSPPKTPENGDENGPENQPETAAKSTPKLIEKSSVGKKQNRCKILSNNALRQKSQVYTSVYKMWGQFYQGGRKDPISQNVIYTDGKFGIIAQYASDGTLLSSNPTLAGPVSIGVSIQNPRAYITSNYYWENTRDMTLWGVVKTLYDPCPKGWQLAQINTFSDFTGTDEGWIWGDFNTSSSTTGAGNFVFYNEGQMAQVQGKVTCGRLYRDGISTTPNPRPIAWFPAGGYVNLSNGSRNAIGDGVYSWTCSAGRNGLWYDLNSPSTRFGYAIQESYGLQARCVRE